MNKHMKLLYFFIFCLSLLDIAKGSAPVIAIDFGADYTKVALVKPGVPMEIVLNKESRRKTESLVGFHVLQHHQEELAVVPIFGSEATSALIKTPVSVFPGLKNLLGFSYDDASVINYGNRYQKNILKNPNTSRFAFDISTDKISTSSWSVEELIALQLKIAKDQAEAMAGGQIVDCVITIPRHFSQSAKEALADAVELAGLKTLKVINDDTAVAINFAIQRQFGEGFLQRHIFFSVGASSTSATLVKFTTEQQLFGSQEKTVPILEIESSFVNPDLGGSNLDQALSVFILNAFFEKHPILASSFKDRFDTKIPSTQILRAKFKVLREATRVKEMLTVNQQAIAHVESFLEDEDLHVVVKRSDLENIMQPLLSAMTKPLLNVLPNGSTESIDSVVLFGGTTRIPALQTALRQVLNESDLLATTVNADEAAVLGAIFEGAGLSRRFVVRPVVVRELFSGRVTIEYLKENRTLFEGPQRLPATEQIIIAADQDYLDFHVRLETGLPDSSLDVRQYVVHVSDIETTKKTLNASTLVPGSAHVELVLEMTPSSLFVVKGASLVYATKNESETTAPSHEGLKEKFMHWVHKDKSSHSVNLTWNATSLPMTIEEKRRGVNRMTNSEKISARQRFAEMFQREKTRHNRDAAKNKLESYVYQTLNRLQDGKFDDVSTRDERHLLESQLKMDAEWLYSEAGKHATQSVVESHINALEKLESPISLRLSEMEARPLSLSLLQQTLEESVIFLEAIQKNMNENETYSEKDIEKLMKVIKQTNDWLESKEKIQKNLRPFDTPVLLSTDINAKIGLLQHEIQKLLNKPKVLPVKKPIVAEDKKNENFKDESPISYRENQQSTNNTGEILEGVKEVVDEKFAPNNEAFEKHTNLERDEL